MNVPVMVRVLDPAVGELTKQVAVAVPPEARVMLAGQDSKRVDGPATARFTVPARPNWLEKVMDSDFEDPALNDIEEGPVMLKSWIVTLRTAVWLREPNVAEIVRE